MPKEEAACRLGVSQGTVWRDIHEARWKVVDALIFGKGIEIEGCEKAPIGRCPKCP